MIPKTINYFWFGYGKKDKIFYKCLKSWKKYLPDFEIIEWNEKNFDINCNNYVKEAYENKKWAFISDYARLKILYEYGGIYFDTDVEIIKKFPNSILETGYFAKERDDYISTGLGFAVYPHNKAIKVMMNDYENINFINGTMDLTPCPVRNTESLIKAGYIIDKNCFPLDEVPVFDRNYFCGRDVYNAGASIVSDKTITVHHYNASWQTPKMKIQSIPYNIALMILGRKNYDKLRKWKNKKNK